MKDWLCCDASFLALIRLNEPLESFNELIKACGRMRFKLDMQYLEKLEFSIWQSKAWGGFVQLLPLSWQRKLWKKERPAYFQKIKDSMTKWEISV